MKLEFLRDITAGGLFPLAEPHNLLRLFDFTPAEAAALALAIQTKLVGADSPLHLHALPFINPVNCTLDLEPSPNNRGIALPDDGRSFHCYLTRKAYDTMAHLVDHFANPGHRLSGYHWLYDAQPDKIGLLLSRKGTW
ncbi:hypothetical protein [Flaviaesturariibacter aridisoli]|uniref:Uncharacterized protein n=1 Tax=Flaviaesturariibacter aridisoli TaxID=2545761 RepID=A0A4R4E0P2_9BACT|nr:hypothetical protein [Flaviaesturariibacter aridisoli]TCZ67730.1 hypothetical protein E0486_15325 [Flaviaesturariibacter aridisoli]